MIGAALREGYVLPLFIQGDHCQVNHKKYQSRSRGRGRRGEEAHRRGGRGRLLQHRRRYLDAGGPVARRRWRSSSGSTTSAPRRSPPSSAAHEPEGVTVSVGAEIGEVGMKNSTVEELHAFMQGYNRSARGPCRAARGHQQDLGADRHLARRRGPAGRLDRRRQARPRRRWPRCPRWRARSTGSPGAVQHGASTLPSNAFGNFPRIETAEIHLATNFQNIIFDHPRLPAELRDRMRRWVDENAAGERKSGDTDEQFYLQGAQEGHRAVQARVLVAAARTSAAPSRPTSSRPSPSCSSSST